MIELACFAGAFVLCWILARFAPLDRPESAPERKLQRGAVPRVGGIVLALGLVALGKPGLCAPLGAAFLVGLADDLLPRGLPRALKFALEAGVCALFAAQYPGSAALGFGLAALALASANTFDNADGALGALGAAGLAVPLPGAAALLCGFLPWNLWIRRPNGAPRAYLGDSGSHLVGLLLASDARSAPFLLLPALDLARLSIVRLRAGSRPWIGDRRHLAHRLQARGLGPTQVVLALLALAAPAWLPEPGWAASATAVLFCAALALAPDPCPGPGAAR